MQLQSDRSWATETFLDIIDLKSSGLKFEVVSGLQELSGRGFRLLVLF